MAFDQRRLSRDDEAIGQIFDVVSVHRNTTSWYNNASFALPLAAAILVGLAGLVTRRSDVLGFAGFLCVVTLGMVPVVLVSWRSTPTAVVLSMAEITSLHEGRLLRGLPWSSVVAITRRETQGNVRWIVSTGGEGRIALDGELEDLDGLVRIGCRLAGLPEPQ